MNAADRVRSASRALSVLLIGRLAFPLLAFVVMRVVGAVTAGYDTLQLVGSIIDGVEGLLTLTVVIVYMVWLARVYGAIAARGGKTSMGVGLAIGGWFIPIGNFFLPWLGLRAAWRGARTDGSALVGVWWVTYMLGTLLTVGQNVAISTGSIPIELVSVFNVLGWINLLLTFATFGCWLAIVSKITTTLSGSSPAPVPAGTPRPLAT